MRKLLVMAATSVALAAAPTIVSAQQAAAPAPTRSAEVQPASEQVEGSELRGRTGFIIPLALLVGIILALLLTQKDEKQILPTSP